MIRHVAQPYSDRSGLYVVDFGDRVKIGKAESLRGRLLQHYDAGAKRVTIFPGACSYIIETRALREARRRGKQIGKSESFTELSYRAAQRIVRRTLRAANLPYDSEPVDLAAFIATRQPHARLIAELRRAGITRDQYLAARLLNIPLARLTEEPKP